MTSQPSGSPWRGQAPPPPSSVSHPSQSPSSHTTVELPITPARRWWARIDPLPKALLVLGLPVLLFCGLLMTVAALVSQSAEEGPAAAGPAAPAVATASATPSPVVVTRTVTETEEIPFDEVTVEDSSLPEGTEEVRTEGVAGELTVTYEVTIVDGAETDRRRVSEEVTREPVDQVTAIGTMRPEPEPAPEPASEPEPAPEEESGCHPSYDGSCVPPGASDVDCEGGGGNGPAFIRGPVWIIGPDVFDLDRDGDGVACE